jgi:APA family basic amino acid/polyamine antiporter
VTFSAGESGDPQRTFGRGIVMGTLLLIGIYVLANVGYLSALGVDGVASSNRVASNAASAVMGPAAAKVLAAVILVSIFGAANGLTLTLPRLFFAMARDRLFFGRLATVHPRFGTPAYAIVGTAIWAADRARDRGTRCAGLFRVAIASISGSRASGTRQSSSSTTSRPS